MQTSVQIWKWKWTNIGMVRLTRNMLEIQKGVDRYGKVKVLRKEIWIWFECEDDDSWNKKGLIKVKMKIKWYKQSKVMNVNISTKKENTRSYV